MRLAELGSKSTAKVARDLGVNVEILRRWVRAFGTKKNGAAAITTSEHEELIGLRRRFRQVTEERDILKNPSVSSRRNCREIPAYQGTEQAVPRKSDVQSDESIGERILPVGSIC